MTTDRLPATPVGRQAAWVLERFGHALKTREIKERFAPSFLEAVSPLKVKVVTLSMKAQLPLTVTDVAGDEHRLRVSLEGPKGSLSLVMEVGAEEPHRIVGLLVRPAGPTVRDAFRGTPPSRDVRALLDEHLGAYASKLKGGGAGAAVAVRFADETTTAVFGGVSEDSVFEIGSVTKPVTATLLAEMVAAGEVALEDPVDRYLPPAASFMDAEGAPVTLFELATHSSGLPRLPVNLDRADESDPYATFTVEDLFEGLPATPLRDRGKLSYSNLGYALLGQVLARATGKAFADLGTERVLQPLGMTDARVGPDPALEDRRVSGHSAGRVVAHWTLRAVQPAGGIEATVGDVITFVAAHASAGSDSPLVMTQRRYLPQGRGTHMGLAWIVVETDHGNILWHNGGTGGFRSFAGFHPGSGTAIAVLANSSDGDGPDVAGAAVLGALAAAGPSG